MERISAKEKEAKEKTMINSELVKRFKKELNDTFDAIEAEKLKKAMDSNLQDGDGRYEEKMSFWEILTEIGVWVISVSGVLLGVVALTSIIVFLITGTGDGWKIVLIAIASLMGVLLAGVVAVVVGVEYRR